MPKQVPPLYSHLSVRGRNASKPRRALLHHKSVLDDALDKDVAGSVHIKLTLKFSSRTVEVPSTELLANMATVSIGDGRVLLYHSNGLGPCLDSLGFQDLAKRHLLMKHGEPRTSIHSTD